MAFVALDNGQEALAVRRASVTVTLYLARRLATYLLLTLLALAFFAYLIDVVDLMGQLSDKNVSAFVALQKSMIKLPDLMMQILPFAVLMATIITLQQLNRSSELIALRAAGMPARSFLLGPTVVVLITGMAALFAFNPLAASMLKNYERWRSEVFPGSTKGLVTEGGSLWLKQDSQADGPGSYFIYGRTIEPNGQVLNKATVFFYDDNDAFERRIDAEKMILQPGQWQLEKTVTLTHDQQVIRQDIVHLPTTLTPGMIQSSFLRAGTMTIWQLRDFISVLRETGLPSAEHEMMYQRLLALPALLLAMFWLGVPFTLRYVRQGGLGTAIGAGLGMGFIFFLFSNYVATFGVAGRLSVTLAAWIPTAIAALIATALMIQLREE